MRAVDQRSGSPRRRLIVALFVLTVLLAAVVGRLAMLQTTNADQFRSAGVQQWTRTIDLGAQRGTIFDRNGHELAMSVPAVDISINPKLLENGPAVVQLLDDLLDLDDDTVAELLAEVAAADRGFVYVARQADADVGEQIAGLRLAGVNVDATTRREMPGGRTGRTVIGRTDIDGIGISGLEAQYDELLTGTGGQLTREIAPGGRTIPGSEEVTTRPVPGDDIVLTLDRSIQFATEQVMLDRVDEINARGGLAVVMDTDTGEILANVSIRRDSTTGEPEITSGNFVAVDSYEPGSVAKVITVAGALDQGVVTPDSWFEIPWRKQYYDDLLSDAVQHPTEPMSVSDILIESSNIGTITIQEQMGRFVHHDYMTAFGLGSKTALDFPGESAGIFKDADELWGSERVTVSYGQGLSTTPLQMVSAVNVIANGGVYVEPKLVLGTVGPDGRTTDAAASGTRRVVSETAAAQTSDMMRQVVCDGTATRAQVPGISVAGKTGTAFKAHENGTYFDERGNRVYYASFVGFFPAEDPELTVLIAVDQPPAGTGDRFGGTAAAPAFAELVPTLIHERGITPPEGTVGCGAG
ncbi:MAG: penicillin-binding protein 2 [Actinomycetota bacterium]